MARASGAIRWKRRSNRLRRGPLDYLTLDYLAEVTMSILQKQRSRDPRTGYARDFVEMIGRGAPDIAKRGVKIVANAGGVNPQACREAVAKALNHPGTQNRRGGRRQYSGAAGRSHRARRRAEEHGYGRAALIHSCARPKRQCVFRRRGDCSERWQGAQIVITGRTTDTGLVLGPMIHEFSWKADDWDKLAAGTIAGHTVECGAQCTGGNCQVDWQSIPNMADIGYPIVEAEPDGTFVITKHAGTGGRVTVESIKEQLLYEMGDPHEYITPDCVADFTTIHLEQAGAGSRAVLRNPRHVRQPTCTRFPSAIRPDSKPSAR